MQISLYALTISFYIGEKDQEQLICSSSLVDQKFRVVLPKQFEKSKKELKD